MSFVRHHPILAILAALVAAAVGLVAVTGVAVFRAAHQDDASRVEHADVIAVFGAAEYGGKPSPVLAGRLEHAQLLYQQGRSNVVLVLGAGRPGDISTEAEAGRDYVIGCGLPPEAVVAIPVGHTTLESLRAAAAYMEAHGMRSVFLVSDPWHNLRIKRMASDLGIEGYASATWHSAAVSEWPRLSGYLRETFAYLLLPDLRSLIHRAGRPTRMPGVSEG